MKVRFRTNLGSRDAESLKLDFRKCQDGDVLDVSDSVGAVLIKRGIAEAASQPIKAVPPPVQMQAVPPESKKAKE